MEQQIRESRTSLEKDIKALSELLARLGKETPKAGPWPPGSLAHLWDLSVRPSPGDMQVRKQQLELDMEQQTGSK